MPGDDPDSLYARIAPQEHEAIVSALEARDKAKVTEAMHEHVTNQAVAVKAVIQEQSK